MAESENEMEERMRRKKEEEEAMWAEYIEQRKKQRQKEEEELKKLKERQVRRKAQRADQEKQMLELKRKQEEQKLREIEEKKAKDAEAKRKRLEEAEKKRQAMLDAMKETTGSQTGNRPNYVVNKKATPSGAGGVQYGNLMFARAEILKTKEQLAEDKKVALELRLKPLELEGLDISEIRKKASDLWDQIVQLESEKYDLEERRKRQDYDLKELNERQRQMNRNKALKKGLDPEAFTGKYPPKINTSSKYERRVDRRTFGDKKTLFEGGWEELYKQYIEKQWDERNKEWKEKDTPKLLTWNPNNPKNKETYEISRTYDEDEEDLMDVSFAPKPEPEPVRTRESEPVRTREPEPEPEEEPEEEEEVDEEEEAGSEEEEEEEEEEE